MYARAGNSNLQSALTRHSKLCKRLKAGRSERRLIAMKLLLITVVIASGLAEVFGMMEITEVSMNKKYFNFITTDTIHAACYEAFCECGKEEFSSHISDVHQESCDTHRVNLARKQIRDCLEDGTCIRRTTGFEEKLFLPLFEKVDVFEIDDESCTMYVATCYGLLLRDAVVLYASDDPNRRYLPKNGDNYAIKSPRIGAPGRR